VQCFVFVQEEHYLDIERYNEGQWYDLQLSLWFWLSDAPRLQSNKPQQIR